MKNKPQQTLKSREDFIRFFQSIPSNKWTTCGLYANRGRYCAFGHIRRYEGITESPSERNLRELAHQSPDLLTRVNDRRNGQFPQRSAKARVLAFLKSLTD